MRFFNLKNLALLYFGIPLVLFLLFWFAAPFNFIFTALFLWATIKVFQGEWADNGFENKQPFSSFALQLVFMAAVFMCFAGGVGGFWSQAGKDDYGKHNFIIDALMHQGWPPSFVTGDHVSLQIVYFLGYSLVPGLLSRGAGVLTSDIITFFWCTLGVVMGCLLFLRYFKLRSWCVLLLLIFGGLGLLGNLVLSQCSYNFVGAQYSHWALPLRCVPFFNAFSWSPAYFLTPLILVPLTLRAIERQKTPQAIFWASMGALWNPFVCVGLAPFIAWQCFKEKFRSLFCLEVWMIFLAAVLPPMIYYSSRLFPDKFLFIGTDPLFFRNIIPFFIFEFGVWCLFLDPADFRKSPIWISLLLVLATVPFSLGGSFDWCFRVLMIAHIIIAGRVFASIVSRPRFYKNFFFPYLMIISVMGIYSETTFVYAAPPPYPNATPFRREYRDYLGDLDWACRQYLGSVNKNALTKLLLAQPKKGENLDENWEEMQIERQFADVSATFPTDNREEKPHFWLISPGRLILNNHGSAIKINICLYLRPTEGKNITIGLSRHTPSTIDDLLRQSALQDFKQRRLLLASQEWLPSPVIGKKAIKTIEVPSAGLHLQLELTLAAGETEIDLWNTKDVDSRLRGRWEVIDTGKYTANDRPWFADVSELHVRPANFKDPSFVLERLD